jgi:hypothetical protein
VLELGHRERVPATIALGRRRCGAAALDTHFFEFVERDRWDRGEREAHA